MYANQQIEQIGRDALAELQTERFKKTLRWAFEKSRFYKRKWSKAGFSPDTFSALGDVGRIPFTYGDELVRTSPYDFLTMPLSSVLRIAQLGQPNALLKMYSNGDIAHHVEMMTRVLVAAGVTQASVAGILGDLSDSRFMDIQYALELIGSTVVLLGMDMRRAAVLMEQSGLDVLVSDPRMIMQFVVNQQAEQNEHQVESLNKVICLEESMQNPMRGYIEKRIGAKVYNLFSSLGLGCAGMMFPCQERLGHHIQEDYFYPEIIEFGNGQPIEATGQVGELVVTTLATEAMPLVRYRTGQAVMRIEEPCSCGRTLMRIATPMEYVGNL